MAFLCYLLAAFVFGCVFAQIPPRKGLFPRKGPVPATCTWRGKTYPEGKFQPSPCESCECEWPGRALCKSVICGPRTCVDAEFRPDQCCLVCPTGENCAYKAGEKDVIIKKGVTYRPDPDANTVCRCPEKSFYFGQGGKKEPRAICHYMY